MPADPCLPGSISTTKTVQMIETAPIARVETSGVWNFTCVRPKIFGIAPHAAIEIVVRAVGRIVVCVDAEADVRTEKSSSFCRIPLPKTTVPSGLRTSDELVLRKSRPPTDWAPVVTST